MIGSWKLTLREMWSRLTTPSLLSEMGFTAQFDKSLYPADIEFSEEWGMSQVLLELTVNLVSTEIKDMRTYTV